MSPTPRDRQQTEAPTLAPTDPSVDPVAPPTPQTDLGASADAGDSDDPHHPGRFTDVRLSNSSALGAGGATPASLPAKPLRRRRQRSTQAQTTTIAEVARAAGVSTATVSNVINGRSGMRSTTRERVMQVVRDLDYHVNPTAQNLRAGRTNTVAFLAPQLDMPYFGQLATRLADGLERMGKQLVLQRSSIRRADELTAASLARLRLYDAVIMNVVDADPRDIEKLNFSTPVVLLGEKAGPSSLDHVMMDNVGGAECATSFMLTRGSRRVAILGGRHDLSTGDMRSQRTAGWQAAHTAAGLTFDSALIVERDRLDLHAGRDLVHELVANNVDFDGIFAVTDVLALGALRALADLGRPVPQDVQVVGFDNIHEASFAVPALTTIEPGKDELAETTLELLASRLREAVLEVPREERRPAIIHVPSARLVPRQTTRADMVNA